MSTTDRKTVLKRKLMEMEPNVDNSERKLSNTLAGILIICLILLLGGVFSMIVDARTSYRYRIAVNGNHYQCNVIERGNPTYLKDCWQGNKIAIYDPVNLVVKGNDK